MVSNKMLLAFALASAALSGCNQEQEEASAGMPAVEAPAAPANTAPAGAATATAEGESGASAQVEPFDVSTVPVTDEALGEWPYVSVPVGYEWNNEETFDLSRVPFWTGDRLEFVEGKVFVAQMKAAGEKTYSRFEVLKRVEEALLAQGATRIAASKVPNAVIDKDLPENFGSEFYAGAGGYSGDQDVATYLIRHADRTVWVKAFADASSGSFLVAEQPAAPVATP